MESMATPANKRAIMDETGKVAAWLAAGRGIRVWTSPLIGEYVPEVFTPGDGERPDGWRFTHATSVLLGADDVVFFRKVGVAFFPAHAKRFTFSDTAAGWKAAERVARSLPRDNGDAAVRLSHAFTVERLSYATEEKRADGRPLDVSYRVGVIHWSAPRGDA